MSEAGKKVLAGLNEARAVAQGDIETIRKIKVHPSCGCVFCDLQVPLYRDDNGFYHDGPEDTRIACELEGERA